MINDASRANAMTKDISSARLIDQYSKPVKSGEYKNAMINMAGSMDIIDKRANPAQYATTNFVRDIGFDNINSTSRLSNKRRT